MDVDPDLLELEKEYRLLYEKVFKVRFFVLAAAVLLFFQLIFGSVRRRSNNFFIHGGLWLGYTLLPPLTIYTLGLMQPFPHMSVPMYPLWALFLFLVAGGANSITAYDLDDNKQWKRRLFDVIQYNTYFCVTLFRLLYPSTGDKQISVDSIIHFLRHKMTVPIILLLIVVFISPTFGVVASWMVNYSDPSKVVADYMKDHAKFVTSRSGPGEDVDPVTMKGCKYLVWWPYKVARIQRGGKHYTYKSMVPTGVVTVEMVWDKCNREDTFTSHGISSSRIKGACLAYSLSHLLLRRLFGMNCAEAGLLETRQFVLQGMLSEKNTDEYTEAFRVIEVELAFLYDYFYTKYYVIFENEGLFFLLVIAKIICSFVLGALLFIELPYGYRGTDYYLVFGGWASVIITVTIVVAFLVMEVLQSILYLGSDWAMISLACCSITGRSHGFIPLAFHKGFGFLISRRRQPLFRHWQKKLGQYSVIEGSKFFGWRKDFAFESSSMAMFIFSKAIASLGCALSNLFSRKGLHFVELPDTMKPQIVLSLISSGGSLTNGEASLQQNLVFERFSWALQNETQTENMLIWHIATDYCRISLCPMPEVHGGSSQEGTRQLSIYQYSELATKLSCYCAYLMSNAPELLPGNSVDTKFELDHVMLEAREALGSKMRTKEALEQAILESRDAGTIFAKGLRLGRELEGMKDGCWKVMADFWVETILYIAPSDNAKAHMEHLAQGGEFLTHLWALLTHAGILTR